VPLEVEIERNLPGFTLRVAFRAENAPLGILGASGAGKSMTLRAIAGFEPHLRGRVVLDGRVLFDSAAGIRVPSRARNVGLLFQHYALFPHLTVLQNITFGLRRLEPAERTRRAALQMAALHLSGLENQYPGALSGGQQQRVALARCFAPQPAALLLDEPFSALDTHLRSQLELQLHETLNGYAGVTLLVSHNLEEIYRLCGEIVVLDNGRVIASGPREEIFRRPPNVVTARLTGCKNFSRARVTSSSLVEALDWNCSLRCPEPMPSAVGHVGVRAHHVCVGPMKPGSDNPLNNEFPCWLAAATQGPFRVTAYLRMHSVALDSSDYHLQVEIPQEHWAELQSHSLPWSVRLPPECLIILPD
jgi:ABC-type sulfate/molybdate transport systems ATPase subunit